MPEPSTEQSLPHYSQKRRDAKLDIFRVVNEEQRSESYVWDEGGVAVRLSEVHQENHQGLSADFAAEYPIGTDVKSGIKIVLDRDASRKATIRAMHDTTVVLGLPFKEWDTLIETACSEAVRAFRAAKAEKAKEMPDALTVDDLLAMDLPAVSWLVDDFITICGITIFAGLPKIGKSIMVLNLCKAITEGGKFLGRDCKNVPVLYLALEDTKSRLKSRLTTLQASGTGIKFLLNFPDLREGLDPLKNAIAKFKPRIVFIDTLLSALCIKDENSPEVGIAVNAIHDLAVETEVSFGIVHHHGKSRRDDPVLDLRGHTSLSGAVDTIVGIYKTETAGSYTLKSASRDGEPLDLDLDFDRTTLVWSIDQAYRERQKAETDIGLVQTLTTLGPRASLDLVCQSNGKDRSTNWKQLERLVDEGYVLKETDRSTRPEKVVYTLKD